MADCGQSGSVRVLNCNAGGARSWQRWATQDEINTYHESGDLPAHETEAQVPVSSCNPHAVACGLAEEVVPNPDGSDTPGYVGTDLATKTHDAECTAPAPGETSCSVCSAYVDHRAEA